MAFENLRESLARSLWNEGIEQMEAEREAWRESYQKRPHRFTEDMLAPIFEVDPRLLDMLWAYKDYEPLSQDVTLSGPTESDRRMAVDQARFLYDRSVEVEHAVGLWTNFGFGRRITITPRDENANDIWKEFWEAPRNRPVLGARNLHKNSDRVLIDGEIFWAVFTATDTAAAGQSTIRSIDPLEIKEIITHPDDKDFALYFRREYVPKERTTASSLYYPNWLATEEQLAEADLPEDALLAQERTPMQDVRMIHAAHKTIGMRGKPITSTAAPWVYEHKRFREARVAIQQAVAAFLEDFKVSGSGTAVDRIRSQLAALNKTVTGSGTTYDSPGGGGGGYFVSNDQIERTRRSLQTGAGDAKTDGEALYWMAGLGLGHFPHYGGQGDAYRLATATSMELPLLHQWQRYQEWWASVWRDVVNLILSQYAAYAPTDPQYQTMEIDITTDGVIKVDIQQIGSVIESIMEALDVGALGLDDAERVVTQLIISALNTLGVANVDEIITADPRQPEGERGERLNTRPFG